MTYTEPSYVDLMHTPHYHVREVCQTTCKSCRTIEDSFRFE